MQGAACVGSHYAEQHTSPHSNYSFIDAWGTSTNGPYPWYPNEPGGGYLIAADSALYAYGTLGGMTQADNSDARVRRSYYPGGALKTDTLIIRTEATVANGGTWTSHVYGLRHAYDRNGRRVDLTHPHQLAPRSYSGDVLDHTLWAYDRATGALVSVTDPLGAQMGFSYNAHQITGRPAAPHRSTR